MTENEIATKIIGAAIEVHKQLGPGLLESTYESCLVYVLRQMGLEVQQQLALPVLYKEVKLEAGYRIDVLVENKVIIELKSLESLADIHTAQLLTYLKLKDLKLGLLINFNEVLLKNGLKRAGQPKDQVQDALEASILEVVPKIEKRLPIIALMANISTLFGLLGTIQGLIASFAAVAGADAAEKAQLLALGISTAMNTTAMGLISAITLMLLHAYLASKGDKMIKEIEENSVKLIDLLGAKKTFGHPDQAA